MLFNENDNFSNNRSVVILIVILGVLIIILLGVLYFLKQKDLGQGPSSLTSVPLDIEKENNDTDSVKKLINLTTAPENNPDIKPNPSLNTMTNAPENTITSNDVQLIDKLTAPKN